MNIVSKIEAEKLQWAQAKRLRFIEYLLFWEGKLNRVDVEIHFKISTPQASNDIQRYIELAPNNLTYNRSERRYDKTNEFKAVFFQPSPEGYLSHLVLLNDEFIQKDNLPFKNIPNHDFVPKLEQEIDLSTFRSVLFAILDKEVLEISYQSMSSPKPKNRKLVPTLLINNNSSWLFRAFCLKDNKYKDFKFSRTFQVLGNEELNITLPKDTEIEEEVTLTITPHPQLSESQQKGISQEYGMINNKLDIKIKKAFLMYFITRYNFDIQEKTEVLTPFRQQIWLKNKEEIVPYINS